MALVAYRQVPHSTLEKNAERRLTAHSHFQGLRMKATSKRGRTQTTFEVCSSFATRTPIINPGLCPSSTGIVLVDLHPRRASVGVAPDLAPPLLPSSSNLPPPSPPLSPSHCAATHHVSGVGIEYPTDSMNLDITIYFAVFSHCCLCRISVKPESLVPCLLPLLLLWD